LELFSNIPIVDFAQEPKYKKCTENEYEPEEPTKNFPTTPKQGSSIFTYSYDSSGRKIKEVEDFGTSNYRSKIVTEWTYDSNNRVLKTVSGYVFGSGTTSAQNCVYAYDGDSHRLTKKDCFDGALTQEEDQTTSLEITYDLPQRKRTIIEKKRITSSQGSILRQIKKSVEEHSDTDYSFIINATHEDFDFDTTTNTSKLKSVSTTESQFKEGKFASITMTDYSVAGDVKKKTSLNSCEYSAGKIKCKGTDFNDKEEAYQNYEFEHTPVMIKYQPSDILCASSGSGTCNSRLLSKNFFDPFYLVTSFNITGIDGKLNSQGKPPDRKIEATITYNSPYRPWMLKSGNSTKAYGITADGKYKEFQEQTTTSNNGDTITKIKQERENNGTATTRDALGEFENKSKVETICERN
ncbi:MAG: hypothetical protein ACO3A4_13065, partial [Silvanigrellaceae bacterium]